MPYPVSIHLKNFACLIRGLTIIAVTAAGGFCTNAAWAAACPAAPASVPDSPAPPVPPFGTPLPAGTTPSGWPPAPGLPLRCPAVPLAGSHATYNVGPGKHYTSLNDVPWLNLVAGDVVNIYYSPTPYATKIALRAGGTASAPVVINGVANASGKLPLITGKNATTATDAIQQGFFTTSGGSIIEEFGVFTLYRGLHDAYGYKPSFVTIQNLRITGAAPGNTFTDHTGALHKYPTFTGGIYVVASQHLTVQNDELFGNGIGVFVNDQNDTAGSSFYTTLRGNYIHDNGVVGNWSVHNLYVQGTRSLYEGNYIGQLIPGALGSALKDRSSGTVIRYNHIDAAARAIDLVDAEGGSPYTGSDKLYNTAWVYGNAIVDDFSLPGSSSGDMIHWGGDSTVYKNYHNGSLYFYDNTVMINASKSQTYSLAIFDMPTNKQTIVAANNVITHTGNSDIILCTNSLPDGTTGTLRFTQANWLTPYTNAGACTLDTSAANMLPGTPVVGTNGHLLAGSPAIGAGTAYPPATLKLPAPASLARLQVTSQFALLPGTVTVRPTYKPRATVTDLGAFPSP